MGEERKRRLDLFSLSPSPSRPLTGRAKLLERRPDHDPSGLGARRGGVVRAQRDAVPLPGLQLERRRRLQEHRPGGCQGDAVDRQQRRADGHVARLEVDAHERERGAADEDELGVGRRAGPERRGVDDRGPAWRLVPAAAAPRRPHPREPVDRQALGHGLDALAVFRVHVLLLQRRGPRVVLVREEDGRRVDPARELRHGRRPRVRDDERAAEAVDVGELLRVVVVPVGSRGVDDEVVQEDGRRGVGDVSGAGRGGREFPPAERHSGHSDLGDRSDAVFEVGLDLLEGSRERTRERERERTRERERERKRDRERERERERARER